MLIRWTLSIKTLNKNESFVGYGWFKSGQYETTDYLIVLDGKLIVVMEEMQFNKKNHTILLCIYVVLLC